MKYYKLTTFIRGINDNDNNYDVVDYVNTNAKVIGRHSETRNISDLKIFRKNRNFPISDSENHNFVDISIKIVYFVQCYSSTSRVLLAIVA